MPIGARDALSWAFHHHYHADKANAAIHTSEVRFSPLTFRLAEALLAECDHVECDHVEEVMRDVGKYAEDRGRAVDS